tara:strand:+ start:12165 stop:12302 length:138 start_codon:yes stop_codon:yes gene_type:complete
MCILLDGCTSYLICTPIVTKVNDFAALALQDSPKYPYGSVMAIKN